MNGMEGSVPPDWIGVDRLTSFGPVQPVHWSNTRGSAHAEFLDHHRIAIYTEVADPTRGTVTYTALRYESTAGVALHRAVWAEQRLADGWLVAAPVLPDDGAPAVGAPVLAVPEDPERQPWQVGSYPSTLPRPSQRVQAQASGAPAEALAHRGFKRLADRWGADLLTSHGFNLARALRPRRHPGGRPGTPDHIVARLAAIFDWEMRVGPLRGVLRRTERRLQELDGEWEWTTARVKSMRRRAADLGFLTSDLRITPEGVTALDPADRALLHLDAFR